MPSASDIAFTLSVKAVQERRGSRKGYAQMEEKGGWATTVSPDLAAFIAEVRSFYLATASEDGQPYIQHRGGPKGFLHVLDDKTLAFADFTGNRQYITTGNLAENARAFIFLMNYGNRRRVKLWGEAQVVEDDPELMRRLTTEGYRGRPEQVIVFKLEAWDVNCPQHIPQMFYAEDIKEAVNKLKERIARLEQENAALRATQNKTEEPGEA
jgi:uncharacterized protein